jgi:hypothetical protein
VIETDETPTGTVQFKTVSVFAVALPMTTSSLRVFSLYVVATAPIVRVATDAVIVPSVPVTDVCRTSRVSPLLIVPDAEVHAPPLMR